MLSKVSGIYYAKWHNCDTLNTPLWATSHFSHKNSLAKLEPFSKLIQTCLYSPLILTNNAKCPIMGAINEFSISGKLCIISEALHEG